MTQTPSQRRQEPLAIIGAWCRLPGANSPADYWDLLVRGGDATGELPDEILDRELYYSPEKAKVGCSYSTVGGLVDRRSFEQTACPLPERLRGKVDESHLQFGEVTAEAIRDAGLSDEQLRGQNVGVYVGHTGGTSRAGEMIYSIGVEETSAYLAELETIQRLQSQGILTERQRDEMAARIRDGVRRDFECREGAGPDMDFSSPNVARVVAESYGLKGPTLVVDAACASSLQALALASRALGQGSIDMALVGGASCCKGDSLILFSAAQSVAESTSRPFDADASGLVTSEGYVTLVVKRLSDAIAAGDRVRCVIRSLGVSSDGKGKSLWAPLEKGQKLAVRRAYENSLPQQRIQYIEAHATSTQVGDATELTALGQAFCDGNRKIPLGSAKANVGHTLETAGLAGLLKAMLAMEHGQIPPCANLQTPNPNIDWAGFHLPTTTEPWPTSTDDQPRAAAVNAFGIGGLNVHVVLEEFADSKASQRETAESVKVHRAERNDEDREPIAIVGMGCVLPGANNVAEFWDIVNSGRDARRSVTADRWDPSLTYAQGGDFSDQYRSLYRAPHATGGFCSGYEYDWRKHRVPPKQIQAANPLQFMLLDAADQALKDSGVLESTDADVRQRIGVIVGTNFGGDFSNQLQMGLRVPDYVRRLRNELTSSGIGGIDAEALLQEYRKVLLKRMPALVDETGSFTSSTLASRITKTFDLNGGAAAIDGGAATGLLALEACVDILRSGDCDTMICAAGQRSMDLSQFVAIQRGGMLATDPSALAFDETSDGYVPGEGCCVFVLKRLRDAVRDGNPVAGVIRDIGSATNHADTAAAYRDSVASALSRADVTPDELCLIEATGATPKISEYEVRAFDQLMTNTGTPKTQLPIHSIVSQFGFLGAAHALTSVMKNCLAIGHGEASATNVPPRPRRETFAESSVQPQTEAVRIDGKSPRSAIAVLCGSPTASVSTVILEPLGRPTAPKSPQAAPSTNRHGEEPAARQSDNGSSTPHRHGSPAITAYSGADWADLLARVRSSDLHATWSTASRVQPSHPVRLACVSKDLSELQAQLETVAAEDLSASDALPDKKTRDRWASAGIFFGYTEGPRACAFAFPGQGSQYPGMFADLIRHNPEAAGIMLQADAALASLGLADFRTLAGVNASNLGKSLAETQAAMLVSSTLAHQLLVRRGLKPNAVFGHSFGEYSAIVAASGWSITDALRAAQLRAQSVAESRDIDGAMLATDATIDELRHWLPDFGKSIFPANFNGPQQIVLSGYRSAIESAAVRLKRQHKVAIPLAVSCPFHSPLMQPSADAFATGLGTIPIAEPRIPIVSTASLGPMLDAAQIRQSLTAQLTSPVRFTDMVEQLAPLAPALVVEVGPKQVLTRLAQRSRLLPDTHWMPLDRKGRPGDASIMDVIAQAFCLGCVAQSSVESNATNTTIRSPQETMSAIDGSTRRGNVTFFDATEARRERMREMAKSTGRAKGQTPPPPHALRAAGNGVSGNGTAGQRDSGGGASNPKLAASLAAAEATPDRSDAELAPPPISSRGDSVTAEVNPPASVPHATAARPDVTADQLRQLLVDFVVEQTGYPEEIVEMDADLESELGIDSIKKAQLFGELASQFDLTPRAGMSLDDFNDLESIQNFLLEELVGDDAATTTAHVSAAPRSPELVSATGASDSAALATAPSRQARPNENYAGAAHVDSRSESRSSANTLVEETSAAISAPTNTAAAQGTDAAIIRQQLRAQLLDFVVEQTGYPEEIVEFDADLESELGIDSIKKAQLFGELASEYHIQPREGLTFDDFATLGSIEDFVVEELTGSDPRSGSEAAASETSTSMPHPARETNVPATENTSPPAPSDRSEPVSTSGNGQFTNGKAEGPAAGSDSARESGVSESEISRQLIDFVVEQTGYPEEIIEFDADLESELGIDSIKKAQLFGELASVHALAPREGMTLDDFATLGDIQRFLLGELSGQAPPTDAKPLEQSRPADHAPSAPRDVASYERGKALGEQYRRQVMSQVEALVDGFVTPPPPQPTDLSRRHGDEMAGIAAGVGVNVEAIEALSRTWIGCDSLSPAAGSLAPSRRSDALCCSVWEAADPSHCSYLAGHAYGHFAVPMGVSARGLAITCAPLEEQPSASELADVSEGCRQLLRSGGSVPDATDAISRWPVSSVWAIQLSDAHGDRASFTVHPNGQIDRHEASSDLDLAWWHDAIDRQTSTLRLCSNDGTPCFCFDLASWRRLPTEADPLPKPAINADTASDVMQRHTMRMIRRPLDASPRSLPQSVCVVGEGLQSARIAERLGHQGIAVRRLSVAEFSQDAPRKPQESILLTHPLDVESPSLSDQATGQVATDAFAQLVDIVEGLRLRIADADPDALPDVIALTRMGGDFGFSGTPHYLGGAFTGLLKALRREFPAAFFKTLDFPPDQGSDAIFDDLLREWGTSDSELEVGFRNGSRHVVAAVETQVSETPKVREGGHWLVSGGARGVTYAVARTMALRFGLHLHLVGTTPAAGPDAAWRGLDEAGLKQLKKEVAIQAKRDGESPASRWGRIERQRELDTNLRRLADEGVQATYHVCDLADAETLQEVIEQVKRHGRFDGVIHGAGVEAACRFTSKKRASVERTIAAKDVGAANLIRLTAPCDLDHFVSFGSTSGRFGGLGQADYSLASDLVVKMMAAGKFQFPHTNWVGIHWPAWDEVGMAVRPESKIALEQSGLKFMPPAEGSAHLISELTTPGDSTEVLFLDAPGMLDTDGTMTRPADSLAKEATSFGGDRASSTVSERKDTLSVDGATGHHGSRASAPASTTEASSRLVQPLAPAAEGAFLAPFRLDADRDRFLQDHKSDGRPVVAGVLAMELFARASSLACPDQTFVGIDNLVFENNLVVNEGQPFDGKVILTPDSSRVACRLVGRRQGGTRLGSASGHDFQFMSGDVRFGERSLIEADDPGEPIFGWTPFIYPPEAPIVHGPSFQTFSQLDLQRDGGRALIRGAGDGDPFAGHDDPAIVPIAALDGCFVACALYAYAMMERQSVLPYAIESYRQNRYPGADELCTLRFFYRGSSDIGPLFDFVLIGTDGIPVLEVKKMRFALLKETP